MTPNDKNTLFVSLLVVWSIESRHHNRLPFGSLLNGSCYIDTDTTTTSMSMKYCSTFSSLRSQLYSKNLINLHFVFTINEDLVKIIKKRRKWFYCKFILGLMFHLYCQCLCVFRLVNYRQFDSAFDDHPRYLSPLFPNSKTIQLMGIHK